MKNKTITPKYYNVGEIQEEFGKLSKAEQVDILWSALRHMERFNGRSTWYTVALAMGYRNIEGSYDTWTKGE